MKNLKPTVKGSIILMSILVILAASCRKMDNIPEPPVITTSVIFSLSSNAVTIGSIIKNDDERSPITARGVCWSLMPNLTLNNNNYTVGDLNDSILFCRIEGLTTNTKYYARALATNAKGTNWETPNFGAINYAGFCALPGGASSDVIGSFTRKGIQGIWWSSTIYYSLYVDQGMIIIRT